MQTLKVRYCCEIKDYLPQTDFTASRTDLPLRNINFSNSNAYFPFYVYILSFTTDCIFTGLDYVSYHCVCLKKTRPAYPS